MNSKQIKPWDIAFGVMYFGRHSLFENRKLIHDTLKNVALLQGCEFYPPEIPGIVAESIDKHLPYGTECWLEYYYFRSGEHPIMPRYMFGRQIASLFQLYGENSDMPFFFDQCGIAEMHTLRLSERASKD